MNYFELFGLPTQFSVDGSLLSSQFRELQKRFHPDNFASGTERERLLSVQKASEINDAFQVLKNPILRAEYLLSLNTVDIPDEQQTVQDPVFLMQQMELREELEQIESSQESEDELFDFDSKVSKLYKELISQVETELNSKLWESAVISVRKLKFIAKLKSEITRVEETLLS